MVPLVWMILMSLKSADQQFAQPPLLVFEPTFENFQLLLASGFGGAGILQGLDFPRYLLNSLVAGFGSTAIVLVLGIPAAYGLARLGFRGGSVVLLALLVTRMLPPMSIAIPLYLISRTLHLFDSIVVLIIVYAAVNIPFTVFLLIGFFQSVPAELEEAAMVDGLSRLGAMVRVAVPLVAPGIAAASILCLWITWTDFQFALILTNRDAVTMPVGIAGIVSQYAQLWGPFGAAGVVYTLPMLIFALLVQRHLVMGLTAGAIKG
ncbi:MAG: carbohydrate ABC transporter permease [Chloroflexota bacterium]